VCCSVLQWVAVCCSVLQYVAVRCGVLQCVACVAVCCSVLQCVAVWMHTMPLIVTWLSRVCIHKRYIIQMYIIIYIYIYIYIYTHTHYIYTNIHMGWLLLVGTIKLQVSFAEYCFFYGALLQKRPIIVSILLTKATPYRLLHLVCISYIKNIYLIIQIYIYI